jgi:uracil-DNA glycosylase
MAETGWSLDRLAAAGRVAEDWVAGLRTADPAIDARIAACLAKVSSVNRYLPVETELNSVLWRAYELPLKDVRVVILGQDPYPDPDRAIGLSFSTGPGGKIPDSLVNIYAELGDAGFPIPSSGDLAAWSSEGVMLLNRALTLPRDKHARPRRHIRWWSHLTIATMRAIGTEAADRPIAAMLWGVPAHGMRKHLGPNVEVFASSHPSPISVHRTAGGERPFRGSNAFGRVNEWLVDHSADPIDWTLGD